MGKRKTTALSMLFASLVRLAGCGKKQGTFGSFTARLDYVYYQYKETVDSKPVEKYDSFVKNELKYPHNAIEVTMKDGGKALYIGGFWQVSVGNGIIELDLGQQPGDFPQVERGFEYSSYVLFTMMCPDESFYYQWENGILRSYDRHTSEPGYDHAQSSSDLGFGIMYDAEAKVAQYTVASGDMVSPISFGG